MDIGCYNKDDPTWTVSDNQPFPALANGESANMSAMSPPVDPVYTVVYGKHPDQDRLNDLVIEVNNHIHRRNSNQGLAIPWLAQSVHSYRSATRKYTFQTGKLDIGGCHLTDELRHQWLGQLPKAHSLNAK